MPPRPVTRIQRRCHYLEDQALYHCLQQDGAPSARYGSRRDPARPGRCSAGWTAGRCSAGWTAGRYSAGWTAGRSQYRMDGRTVTEPDSHRAGFGSDARTGTVPEGRLGGRQSRTGLSRSCVSGITVGPSVTLPVGLTARRGSHYQSG